MPTGQTALLTDLYQLNMLAAYLDRGLTDTAVFELFVRKLPPRRGFLMAAGLEQALDYLETLSFSKADITRLHVLGGYPESFLEFLAGLHFTGDVDAMPEGTVFFPDEPIIRVVPGHGAGHVKRRELHRGCTRVVAREHVEPRRAGKRSGQRGQIQRSDLRRPDFEHEVAPRAADPDRLVCARRVEPVRREHAVLTRRRGRRAARE